MSLLHLKAPRRAKLLTLLATSLMAGCLFTAEEPAATENNGTANNGTANNGTANNTSTNNTSTNNTSTNNTSTNNTSENNSSTDTCEELAAKLETECGEVMDDAYGLFLEECESLPFGLVTCLQEAETCAEIRDCVDDVIANNNIGPNADPMECAEGFSCERYDVRTDSFETFCPPNPERVDRCDACGLSECDYPSEVCISLAQIDLLYCEDDTDPYCNVYGCQIIPCEKRDGPSPECAGIGDGLCHDDPDQPDPGMGYCGDRCVVDSDCVEGTRCAPSTGLCRKMPVTPEDCRPTMNCPNGQRCDVASGLCEDTCSGANACRNGEICHPDFGFCRPPCTSTSCTPFMDFEVTCDSMSETCRIKCDMGENSQCPGQFICGADGFCKPAN